MSFPCGENKRHNFVVEFLENGTSGSRVVQQNEMKMERKKTGGWN
jgi:hypothetical protein